MTAEAIGEVELDNNVLVIRRIIVRYHLKLDPEKRSVAERALGYVIDQCPLARTIRNCVAVSTALEMDDVLRVQNGGDAGTQYLYRSPDVESFGLEIQPVVYPRCE